jgi:hypothetical protein
MSQLVFYLRLFYTEIQLGWNSEEWPIYLSWVAVIMFAVLIVIAASYILFGRGTLAVQRHRKIFFTGIFMTVTLTIIFFFSAGRVSMLPLSAGVHQMDKYGCCAQAIVYPRNRVTAYVFQIL